MTDPRVNLLDSTRPEDENTELVSWTVRFKMALNTIIRQIRVWMSEHVALELPTNPGEIPDPHKQYAKWGGVWSSAKSYTWNTMVHDDGWLMIANKDTTERPAPQPIGSPEFDLPLDPGYAIQENVGVVWSGHELTLIKNGWIKSLSVWVPELSESTNYRIIIANITDPDNPSITTLEEPVLNLNDWTVLGIGNTPFTAGSVMLVILDALNSGGDTIYTGGWTRTTDQNATEPTAGNWNKRTQDDVLRINHIDADSVNRQTELEGFIPGTSIQFVSTDDPNQSVAYYVDVTTPGTNAVVYNVTRSSTGIAGEPDVSDICTMTATVPVPQSTKYVQRAGYWPSNPTTFASHRGLLRLSGVDQPVPDDAFGVRVEFQEATTSLDWDYMAYSDLSSGDAAVNEALVNEILDIANIT